jgi:signal recognition particle subunit SRP19
MLRDGDKYVIWPAYIDKANSQSGGCIIPTKGICDLARIEGDCTGCKGTGADPTVERDRAYPESWWKVSRQVLVDKKGFKSGTVRKIAKRIE